MGENASSQRLNRFITDMNDAARLGPHLAAEETILLSGKTPEK